MSPVVSWVEVWICICLFPAAVVNMVTTRVSLFENCGVVLKVGRNDRYLLDMSDLLFPRGCSVCQLAFARVDTGEGDSGLLQCELASNSTVSQDVTVILRSYVPDKERTYNSSHWISPKEQLDPAKRLVFTAIRSSTVRTTQLHLSFTVFETDPLDVPWSLSNSVGYLFLACSVIGIVAFCLKSFRKRSAGNVILVDFVRDLAQCITQTLTKCTGKEAPPEARAASSDDGTSNNISSVPSSGDMSEAASTSSSRLPAIPSGQSFVDSPPSYEYCMANCIVNRTELSHTIQPGEQIFTLNSESSRCACGSNSFAANADLTMGDGLPPYSVCVSIRPPSYDDFVTQQLQDYPDAASDSHDPPQTFAQFSTEND